MKGERLYVGIEPEEQTSCEMKDRYGVLAYPVSAARQASGPREFRYQMDIDGEGLEFSVDVLQGALTVAVP